MNRVFALSMIILVGMGLVACGGGSGGNNDSGDVVEQSFIISIFHGAVPADTLSIQTSSIMDVVTLTISNEAIFHDNANVGSLVNGEMTLEVPQASNALTLTGSVNGNYATGTWSDPNGGSGTWEGRKVDGGMTDVWIAGRIRIDPQDLYRLKILQRLDGNLVMGYEMGGQFYAGSAASSNGHAIDGDLDTPDGMFSITSHRFGSYFRGDCRNPLYGYDWHGFRSDDFSDIHISKAYIQFRPQLDGTVYFVSFENQNGHPVPPGIVSQIEITDAAGTVYAPIDVYEDDSGKMTGWDCNGTCEFDYHVIAGEFGVLSETGSLPTGEYTITISTQYQTFSRTLSYYPDSGLPVPPDPVAQIDPAGDLSIVWDPPPPGVDVNIALYSDFYGYGIAGFTISDPNQNSFTIPAAVLEQMEANDIIIDGTFLYYQHYVPNPVTGTNEATRAFGHLVDIN